MFSCNINLQSQSHTPWLEGLDFWLLKWQISASRLLIKEHYHVFAHAQEFDFGTGGQEIKDAGIDIELSQIRLHRPQSTLASP